MAKVSYQKLKVLLRTVKSSEHVRLHGAKSRSCHLLSCFCGSLYEHCKFGDANSR